MRKEQNLRTSSLGIEGLSEIRLSELFQQLRRRKWVILASFLFGTGLATVYNFLAKPVYEASAEVLIDSKAGSPTIPAFDISGGGESKVANELETLKSQAVRGGVAQVLLKRTYVDSTSKVLLPIILPKADGERGYAPAQEVIKRLAKSVSFSTSKESDVIKINAQSTDPREAALIANTYTEVYTERNLEITREKSRAVREFLRDQVQAKQAVLAERDNALQDYMHRSGVVSLDDETKKVVEQMATLEATAEALGVDISAKTKTIESYKEQLASLEPNVARSIGQSSDSYIRILQEQLAKLEVERDLAAANPVLMQQESSSGSISQIDVQIASMRKKLQDRTTQFVESVLPGDNSIVGGQGRAGFLSQLKQRVIETQIELYGLIARKQALDKVLANSERQFGLMPKKTIDLSKLQRARMSSEKLYLMVEERFNEAAIKERSEFGYVTVMDRAGVPDEPVGPRVAFNLLLGGVLGLMFGAGIVLVMAAVDVRVKDPDELTKRGYTIYSTVGKILPSNGKAKPAPGAKGKLLDEHLVSHYVPYSPLSESYRKLLTGIVRSQDGRVIKSVMFTSPNPGEGKSTTCANLGITASQVQRRVLLVDSDLRRPSLHNLFGAKKGPGFSDLLEGRRRFEEVVQRRLLDNLDFLSCGEVVEESAKSFMSPKTRELVEWLASQYDLVLFDSPPLLAVTDPALLCAYVDLTIIVVSGGTTRLDELDRAQEVLTSSGAKAIGVVFNNYDFRKAQGRYYGKDLYSYSSYAYGHPSNGEGRKYKRH